MTYNQSPESRSPGVLLIDDDEHLLSLLSLDLRKQGFNVWIAAHGLVAWQLYEQHHDAIDLVLLDVDMPFFDGLDTLELLQEVNPEVTCWFMSGTHSKYTEAELLARASGIIHKPISSEEMTDALCLAAR
jgi:CheY-like chemotaxis protein